MWRNNYERHAFLNVLIDLRTFKISKFVIYSESTPTFIYPQYPICLIHGTDINYDMAIQKCVDSFIDSINPVSLGNRSSTNEKYYLVALDKSNKIEGPFGKNVPDKAPEIKIIMDINSVMNKNVQILMCSDNLDKIISHLKNELNGDKSEVNFIDENQEVIIIKL